MAKKISSKKFSTAKKKIPSRKFAKSKTKIPSRKFATAPAPASKKPEAQALPDRPTDEAERQDRIKTLKKKLKSLGVSK